MAMTCTPRVESRKMRKLYRNRRVLTAAWKTLDIAYSKPRTIVSRRPFRSSRITSKRNVSPFSIQARNFSRISGRVCQAAMGRASGRTESPIGARRTERKKDLKSDQANCLGCEGRPGAENSQLLEFIWSTGSEYLRVEPGR